MDVKFTPSIHPTTARKLSNLMKTHFEVEIPRY